MILMFVYFSIMVDTLDLYAGLLQPGQYKTLNQCLFTVDPPSTMLAQH